MPALAVHNTEGKKVEEFDLPDNIFGGHVNQAVIHQAVVIYQANERQGTASTKERGAISGGGAKPYRQKGTGQARAGSSRSPVWRGGGTVFGPEPRDFRCSIPKKMRMAALRESLKAKLSAKNITCVDHLTIKSPKTKDFAKILAALKLSGKILALSDDKSQDVLRVSRNIRSFNLMRAQDVNAYDVLRNKKILVTKSALKSLLKRIK